VAVGLCSCSKKQDSADTAAPNAAAPNTPTPNVPAPNVPAPPKPELTALLCFWDKTLNEHVYTYGDGEPANWRKNPAFTAKPLVGYVANKQYPDTVRLFRAYCRDRRHYFYTTKPAGARDIERIEDFLVYVWTKPGDGRVPVHACFLPDDKDPYFDQNLERVKDYVDGTLKGIGKQRKLVENYFYVYPTGPAPSEPAGQPVASAPQAAPLGGPVVAPKADPVPVVRQPVVRLAGHYGPVTTIAAVPSGKSLVSGSLDGTVRLWDLETFRERATFLGDDAMVHRVALTRDGHMLAASGMSGVRLWDLVTRKQQRPTGTEKDVYALAFSADGRSLTAGSAVQVKDGRVIRLDGRLYTWNPAAVGKPSVFNGKRGVPGALGYTADDKWVAVAENGEVALYERTTGQPSSTFKPAVRNVAYVATSPKGPTIAVAGKDQSVTLLDANTGGALGTLGGHRTAIGQLAFSPDGTLLAGAPVASGDKNSTAPDEVYVWDVARQQPRTVLRGPTGSMTAVAFGPSADTVLTGGADGIVSVWWLSRAGGAASDPAGMPIAGGSPPVSVPATAGKLRLQWRPVASPDGTWSVVLPGPAEIKHDESVLPGGASVITDIFNAGIVENDGQLVCQIRVEEFARTPTRDEFESDNTRSLRDYLSPVLGFDLKDVVATTTGVEGQYARRYEGRTRQFGQFVYLRVLVTEPKRTRIISLLCYGPDAGPEVKKAFFTSFRLFEPRTR
jgi:WD40 repeat protein